MDWTEVWSGMVGERNVVLERYAEGDLRVRTVTAVDDEGHIIRDGDEFMEAPPGAAGSPLTIDLDHAQSLREALREQGGFTEEEAEQIASHAS